jgi:hypothetical protein
MIQEQPHKRCSHCGSFNLPIRDFVAGQTLCVVCVDVWDRITESERDSWITNDVNPQNFLRQEYYREKRNQVNTRTENN